MIKIELDLLEENTFIVDPKENPLNSPMLKPIKGVILYIQIAEYRFHHIQTGHWKIFRASDTFPVL